MIDKRELRRAFRARRDAVEYHEHERASAELSARLLDFLVGVKRVALYSSTQNEISVDRAADALRKQGVRTYYPRVTGPGTMVFCRISSADALVAGKFGILEPAASAAVVDVGQLEVVLMPGVAFDVRGARIGFGGGYYDRALADLTSKTRLVGIGYDWQLHDENIPDEAHDIRVSAVITDARVFQC